MTEEEKKELDNLICTLHTHHIDTNILFKMRDTIQKQQEEIEKKDKIIEEMAKALYVENYCKELNCNKCTAKNFADCIKQYFERKAEV